MTAPSGFSTSTCLPACDRLARGRHVVLVGRRDQDGVESGIREHRRVVGEGPRGPVDRAHLGEQVLGEVADRVQLGVSRLGERLEVGELGDRAGAEDADAQRLLLVSGHGGVSHSRCEHELDVVALAQLFDVRVRAIHHHGVDLVELADPCEVGGADLGVIDRDDDVACTLDHRRLDLRLGEAPDADPEIGEPADADERDVDGEALEIVQRQRADHRPTGGPKLPAEEHVLDRRHLGDDASDFDHVGQHAEVGAILRRVRRQYLGERADGRSAVEEDGGAVLDQIETRPRDRTLGIGLGGLAAGQLAVDELAKRDRAAVCALEQPSSLERAQVLADGRPRDAEPFCQLAIARTSLRRHELGDLRLTLVREYRLIALPIGHCLEVTSAYEYFQIDGQK